MPAATDVTEVDDAEDFIMDEDDYSSEVEHAIGEMPEAEPGSKTTSTANFMGGEAEVVDEIQDLGVIEVSEDAETYIVRVVEDIGPVYYGATVIEMKKGHRYQVPPHIHRYLAERDMLWENQ